MSAKRIAFVIDNPDFHGGAHVATFALINRLKKDGHQVDIVSPDFPPIGSFRFRVRQIFGHLHLGWYPDWSIDPSGEIRKKLSNYDVVCCLGEPSSCRKIVSNLPSHVRKVMLIHTDYSTWYRFSPLAKEMSRFDRVWYKRYDCIGVVGKENARKMAKMMPFLADKILPFHNIFEKKGLPHTTEHHEIPRIVTFMRVGDPPKKSERYLDIVKRLKEEGCRFDWYVYGEGNLLENYRKKCKDMQIDDCFHLEGFTNAPMEKLAEADIMVMLSVYEGLPNTIYESYLCATPVLSTNVGGIAEQIQEGISGWLVGNDINLITSTLKKILVNPDKIKDASNNLKDYKYDNNTAYKEQCMIIGIK